MLIRFKLSYIDAFSHVAGAHAQLKFIIACCICIIFNDVHIIAMAIRCSVLDKVYLPLIRYLNVNSVKPYLKQKQLLTDDELERLDLACSQSSQSGAETLVKMLKRKGPCHEGHFLSALKDSMEFDPHQGHHGIISALEAVVEETDQGKFIFAGSHYVVAGYRFSALFNFL